MTISTTTSCSSNTTRSQEGSREGSREGSLLGDSTFLLETLKEFDEEKEDNDDNDKSPSSDSSQPSSYSDDYDDEDEDFPNGWYFGTKPKSEEEVLQEMREAFLKTLEARKFRENAARFFGEDEDDLL